MNDQEKPARFIQAPFKAMTNEDINEYMNRLLKSNGAGLEGVEAQVEASLRTVSLQRSALRNQLVQLQKQDEQLIGQVNALGYILQKAEDERRWKNQQQKETNELTEKEKEQIVREILEE